MTEPEIDALNRYAKTNTYVAHGDVKAADCVIGFSFGYRDKENGISPGKSNEQLAAFIESSLPESPLILQFEIE